MYLIDTHTHIYDSDFDADRAEVVKRALEQGVGMMLLPNVDASTIQPMLTANEQFPDCTRMMMGLQPEEVKGDYKQARGAYGQSATNNAAVQQILNEDYAGASKTLAAVKDGKIKVAMVQ